MLSDVPLSTLIVEDDAETRDNLRDILKLDGHAACRISIRDNGAGFTPRQRTKAFHAFFTTKTKGTGLGLATCRRIIEAHQGQIILGDDPGPGAELILIIPRGKP